ncbi:hypothetical protein C8Q76DRAFT_234960 [Earliella scabrosa]|nr:hypothetical protein C8Q76DRAFT_234960 [Earliella scabrosa]
MPDSERADTPSSPDRRSVSRGREAFSSGRGGIGNIRRPSIDAASPSRAAGEALSPVRGRETAVDPERRTTGRGGMGNIRSGSQTRTAAVIPVPENYPQTASLVSDHAASIAEYERNVIAQAEQSPRALSSGRGGLGNIRSTSESRSRSRPPIHSTGRGGAGNLQMAANLDPDHLAQLEEEERLRYVHDQGLHSTGRGGRANITALHSPPLEPSSPHPNEYETTGRGGVGNMVRSRSGSREPAYTRSRSGSRGPSDHRASSLARMLNKVGLQSPREEAHDGAHGIASVTEDGERPQE